MVRIIEFSDGVQWIARLWMPLLPSDQEDEAKSESELAEWMDMCEHATMILVGEKTGIPVPKVHAVETSASDTTVHASFMLMDCLRGNAGMDLCMTIPSQYLGGFIKSLAQIHVGLNEYIWQMNFAHY